MTEKEVHAGQSNIRLGLVIAAPVLGRVELMPAALRLAHRSRCTTQATVIAPSHTTASVASTIAATIIASRIISPTARCVCIHVIRAKSEPSTVENSDL